MSMYDKTHYNTVVSLQLIKIDGKKKKRKNENLDMEQQTGSKLGKAFTSRLYTATLPI